MQGTCVSNPVFQDVVKSAVVGNAWQVDRADHEGHRESELMGKA